MFQMCWNSILSVGFIHVIGIACSIIGKSTRDHSGIEMNELMRGFELGPRHLIMKGADKATTLSVNGVEHGYTYIDSTGRVLLNLHSWVIDRGMAGQNFFVVRLDQPGDRRTEGYYVMHAPGSNEQLGKVINSYPSNTYGEHLLATIPRFTEKTGYQDRFWLVPAWPKEAKGKHGPLEYVTNTGDYEQSFKDKRTPKALA